QTVRRALPAGRGRERSAESRPARSGAARCPRPRPRDPPVATPPPRRGTFGGVATPLTPAHQRWRIRVFATTWLAYVAFYFCRTPFSIAKSSIQDETHWETSDLGNLYATYLIAYAIGQFLASRMGTRLGPRRNVLLGMALSIAATFAMGVTISLPVLF